MAGALGRHRHRLDLAEVSEAAELDELRRALADHLVVFLPGQDLEPGRPRAGDRLLGGRDVTPFVDPLEDRPYVIRVIKEPTDALNFANAWHSDLSYLPAPPAYTLLHAWDVPDHGGDTVWSNQYLAYESLSEGSGRRWTACAPCIRPAWPTGRAGCSTRSRTSPPWRSHRRPRRTPSTSTRR